MGFIREPEGVDFFVIDRPLTDKERKEISAYIKKCKEKQKNARSTKKIRNRKKVKTALIK